MYFEFINVIKFLIECDIWKDDMFGVLYFIFFYLFFEFDLCVWQCIVWIFKCYKFVFLVGVI